MSVVVPAAAAPPFSPGELVFYPPRPAVQLEMQDGAQHRRDLARATNLLLAGHNSATLQGTLPIGATSAVLIDPRISLQTVVICVPMTANAAADMTDLYVVPEKGQATFYFQSRNTTDRTYQIALIG